MRSAARRSVSTPAARADCGLVAPRRAAGHMRRSVGGCGSGAGRVRCELLTASAGVSKLCSFYMLGLSNCS